MPPEPLFKSTQPLIISTKDFPRELQAFTLLLGYEKIIGYLNRLDQKMKSIRSASDVLRRRYSFLTTLQSIYARIRHSRKINFSEPEVHRAAGIVAAINAAAASLDGSALNEFKSRLLEAMKPDSDFRHIEHELRCFVHLRQNGFSTFFADLQNIGRYDFLCAKNGIQIEIECKTISDSIGSSISTDNSLSYFEAFLNLLPKNRQKIESGVINMVLDAKHHLDPISIASIISDYLTNAAPNQKRYNDVELSFEVKPRWSTLISNGNRFELSIELAAVQEQNNSHTAIAVDDGRVVLFNLHSRKRGRPIRSIIDVCKQASTQFSGSRPAIVWLHFLGLTEHEFGLLAQQSKESRQSPFNMISNYIFRSESRRHLKKLFFSADTDFVQRSKRFDPVYGNVDNLVMGGKVYETTSLKSRFSFDIPL